MSSTPRWTPESKRFIFIVCFILIGLAVWRFSIVLAPLIVAVIIAYLLNPLVNWLTQRTILERGVASSIVYIAFLLILVLIPTIGTPIMVQQIRNLNIDIQELTNQVNEPIDINKYTFGFNIGVESITGLIAGSVDSAATWAANLAVTIAEGLIWTIFIMVVGFYFLKDANKFTDWIDSWVPPAYLDEFKQLRRRLDVVWKSYFFGQVILAIIVGIIIGVSTAILGIRSAVLLGIVAAILELIPNWGYGLSGAIGVLFAYFQGSTWIPLPFWAFSMLVAGFYFVMWQIDTNYLVPRIIGNRLNLSPAIVIVGIIAGASVGGALGLLLAAPTIASVRVLGSYIYRRLLDLEPYVLSVEPLLTDPQKAPDASQEVQPESLDKEGTQHV